MTGVELRIYVKKYNCIDLSSLLPLWLTYYGWVTGLNTLSTVNNISLVDPQADFNWMHSVFIPDNIDQKPREILPQSIVEQWSMNQIRLRVTIIELIGGNQPDIIQSLKNLTQTEKECLWANEYDAVDG